MLKRGPTLARLQLDAESYPAGVSSPASTDAGQVDVPVTPDTMFTPTESKMGGEDAPSSSKPPRDARRQRAPGSAKGSKRCHFAFPFAMQR